MTTQSALLPINSVQELQTLGGILAQSNLFGKRNPAEGLAIVAMCQQKRISWLDFMQNFHMIQGVVAKKTDAILADFHRIGGTHRVVCRDSNKAEAVFRRGETEYPSKIEWSDCLQEPFVYVGLEKDVIAMLARGQKPSLKAKYQTPRARMQMLWARCVSDGVRVVAPECVQGIYTPEETSDFVEVSEPICAAPAPAPTPPIEVQGAASSTPLDAEVCPCGSFAGRRWESLDVAVLQAALKATNPMITAAMKDHIRELLAKKEVSAEVQPDINNEGARHE